MIKGYIEFKTGQIGWWRYDNPKQFMDTIKRWEIRGDKYVWKLNAKQGIYMHYKHMRKYWWEDE